MDRLPHPAAAGWELAALVGDLNTRDFAHLPQDVVGAVFERLIPPEDRHALGQFFTPEPLVDLTAAFCIRQPDDVVLDATCGTGTFLIRSYDRKRTALGLHDHSRQLAQPWGGHRAFPAELATINLFRQQVGMPGNFPRILNDDFFSVVPGGCYKFPPLKAVARPDQHSRRLMNRSPSSTSSWATSLHRRGPHRGARKGLPEAHRPAAGRRVLQAWPEGSPLRRRPTTGSSGWRWSKD
ncbi:N-6 DNA methylase [Candidatus Amarolinea dominans]|uniref:N-6 DNA methylase n=1 Tax=Candidatus Amarolinea dominans TaxID=3140696 RepID=UPI001D9A9B00|nr:SAM-dependent DNA methyltransferase [Anaerolineae bacterium]